MLERDDLIVNDSYSVNAAHDEETGRAVRKRIIQVTIILSVITAVEVAMGIYIKQGTNLWPYVKWSFIVMTLIKAAYIVSVFMHLGDERKTLRYMILAPYLIFAAYLIFVGINESNAVNAVWQTYGQ